MRRARPPAGLTLVELVTALAIVGVLGMIAVPVFQSYREKADIARAQADLTNLQNRIARYASGRTPWRYPDTLADVGGAPLDPWGNPYRYLNIENLKPPASMLRKDKNLVPINTDYDLYSLGPDGASQTPLTAKASRDDVVRANNGRYIGRAESY